MDILLKENAELKIQNLQLQDEMGRLQAEVSELKSSLREKMFDINSLEGSTNANEKLKFYTGLPTFNVFLWVFSICSPFLPTSQILSAKNVLFLVLLKLRLNLTNQDIGYRFGVSKTHVTKLITAGLPSIAKALRFLVRWPSRENILRTLPKVFKPRYRMCRAIIDCTEVFIERAKNLTVRALTWSNYKHHNTIKYLIGITPSGGISFVSRAFGGRASDKVITQRSGFLDLLEQGDLILADRGFLIADDLAAHGASLVIPSFTRGKKQLSRYEVEMSRRISRVRIHVERAMESIKNFKILSGTMPLKLVSQADNIILICAALSNLQPRLVKK